MAYIALYRKYRSQSFGELMGQDHVTTTLQNAIRSGRISQAYLFYGARGCGKTSTARLLARALNCVATDSPAPEPCGVCRLCVSIRDGSCMDVLEMDAASETGIDDVREKIIENVQYAPTEARYKVYIIDEVHDLSAKAFDALLKTLEEPPPHVIFILATTEYHKVPITIRSRCSKYHFKRGTLLDLAKAVERVVLAEGFSAEPEAIQAIARSAEGSWRDALSLLEQVLAYSDGVVTSETVHRALGSVGSDILSKVTETLAQNDWSAALALAGELLESGKDVRQLLTALSGHLRDLMLISAGAKQAAQQELGEERFLSLVPQATLFNPPTLLTMMGIISAAEKEIRFTNQHRWLLESVLLKLMPSNHRLSESAAPISTRQPESRPAVQKPYQETGASTPTVIPRLQAVAPPPVYIQEAEQESYPAFQSETPSTRATSKVSENPAASSASGSEAGSDFKFAEGLNLESLRRAWPRILERFKRASPSGAPFLEKAKVVGLEGKIVVLSFQDSFSRDRIQNNDKGKAKVEQTINQTLSVEGYKIRCILDDDNQNGGGVAIQTPTSIVTPVASGAEALFEMEADKEPTKTGSGFGDINLPVPEPDSSSAGRTSIEGKLPTAVSQPAKPTSPPAESSFVEEALELFGGSIIRSEPI